MYTPPPRGYADAHDGATTPRSRATSDAGYSSDGDMSSMYGAYSLYKPRNPRHLPTLENVSLRSRTKSTHPSSLIYVGNIDILYK